jgi:hypothetical protein
VRCSTNDGELPAHCERTDSVQAAERHEQRECVPLLGRGGRHSAPLAGSVLESSPRVSVPRCEDSSKLDGGRSLPWAAPTLTG